MFSISGGGPSMTVGNDCLSRWKNELILRRRTRIIGASVNRETSAIVRVDELELKGIRVVNSCTAIHRGTALDDFEQLVRP